MDSSSAGRLDATGRSSNGTYHSQPSGTITSSSMPSESVTREFSNSIRSIRSAEPRQSPSASRPVGTAATGSKRHSPLASDLISACKPAA